MEETPEAKIEKYKADLAFFMKLRSAVKKRYAEVVDFKEYEAKIQKLIDTHVGTGEVEKITTLVNIFDKDAFLKEIEKLEEHCVQGRHDRPPHEEDHHRADGGGPGVLPQVLRDARRRHPGLPRETAGRPGLSDQGHGDRRLDPQPERGHACPTSFGTTTSPRPSSACCWRRSVRTCG